MGMEGDGHSVDPPGQQAVDEVRDTETQGGQQGQEFTHGVPPAPEHGSNAAPPGQQIHRGGLKCSVGGTRVSVVPVGAAPRRKEEIVYIGLGTVVLIIVIVAVVMMLRRR
ncbi:hypothetical protein ACQ86D_04155 [Streptomyces galilaeus]